MIFDVSSSYCLEQELSDDLIRSIVEKKVREGTGLTFASFFYLRDFQNPSRYRIEFWMVKINGGTLNIVLKNTFFEMQEARRYVEKNNKFCTKRVSPTFVERKIQLDTFDHHLTPALDNREIDSTSGSEIPN